MSNNTYQYPYKNGFKETCHFKKVGDWKAGYHIGVDLVGVNKNIYPVCDGVVQSINDKGSSYGNHILIKHSDNVISLYAHLSKINVKKGESVTLDTVIGVEGSTGNSTGSHLHLELHKGTYKYPNKNENATWLLNPVETIESNKAITIEQAIQIVRQRANLSTKTIEFMSLYRYDKDLFLKLAKNMTKTPNEIEITVQSAITIIQSKCDISYQTIMYMYGYIYGDELLIKLAKCMN